MIAEALRGQGLGRALWAATLAALTARAPAAPPRGLHGTWLIYRPTNPTGARFWPALGYIPLYHMWRRGGWTRDEG
jgi:GNAT superfamily N-acetyltransferase